MKKLEDDDVTTFKAHLFSKGALKVFMSEEFFNTVKCSIGVIGSDEGITEIYDMVRDRTKDLISPQIDDFSLRYYCFIIGRVLDFFKDNGFPINNKSLVVHCVPNLMEKLEVSGAGVRSILSVKVDDTEIDTEIVFDPIIFKEHLFITFIHEFIHYFFRNTKVEAYYLKLKDDGSYKSDKEQVYERFTSCISYFLTSCLPIPIPTSHFGYIYKKIKKNPNYPSDYLEKRIKELRLNGILGQN